MMRYLVIGDSAQSPTFSSSASWIQIQRLGGSSIENEARYDGSTKCRVRFPAYLRIHRRYISVHQASFS